MAEAVRVMPYVVLTAKYDCKVCHGEGVVRERHPYGSTYATETLDCDCVFDDCPTDLMELIMCDNPSERMVAFRVDAHPKWIEETQMMDNYYYQACADDAMKGSL